MLVSIRFFFNELRSFEVSCTCDRRSNLITTVVLPLVGKTPLNVPVCFLLAANIEYKYIGNLAGPLAPTKQR